MDSEAVLLFLEEFKKDTKESLEHLRATNHDINNELHGVNGQLQLLRQSQETQKEDMESKFERVHMRIDKEQQATKEEVQDVKKSLEGINNKLTMVTEEIVPKVKSWDETLKIVKKIVLTAVTLAVLGLITSKMTGLI